MKEQKNQRIQYALKIDITLLDRYVIKEVLDQNGLSITYRAYDTFREQTVALKELYPAAIVARNFDNERSVECVQLSNEKLFEQMKEQSIQKAKKMIKLYPLSGMANVIHYIEANNTVYYVMEYVEGINLPTFIHKKHTQRLELDKTVTMLKPVFDSLQKVHKTGMFHGRIRPESIILNDAREPKLTGFGDPMEEVARDILGDTTAREDEFAPVEQYVPGGAQSATTDVYAIAAVIYFCVTGVRPPAFYERVGGVTGEDDPLRSPWELGVSIMEYQSDVLMKALAVYTFDRYQTLSEFVEALGVGEFKDAPRMIYLSKIPSLFARRERNIQRRKMFLAFVFIAVISVSAISIYKLVWHQKTKNFYTKFEKVSFYDRCEMLAALSDTEKKHYGNNYEKVSLNEEGEAENFEIRYYDPAEERSVVFENLRAVKYGQEYICIDFRTDNRVWVSYLKEGESTSYYYDLDKAGSYYYIEKSTNKEGIRSKEETLKVSRENANG